MSDSVMKRTSVRQFTDKEITDEQVERLMRAAMAAPSAANQQPWEFVLARDAQKKELLSQCSPYAKPAAGAALVIVPCIAKDDQLKFPEYKTQDMGACAENILVEAAELGLGAVWMGIYPEQDRMDAVAGVIEIPAGHEPFALIAVGYPIDEPEPRGPQRYDEARVHWA